MTVFMWIADQIKKRPKIIVALALVITLLLGAGIVFVRGQVDYYDLLPPDFTSVKSLEYLKEHFGGINYVNVLIKADDVTSPHLIEALSELKDDMESDPRFNEGKIVHTETYLDPFFFNIKKEMESRPELEVAGMPPGSILHEYVNEDYLTTDYAQKWIFNRSVSPDLKATLVMLKVGPDLSDSEQIQIANDLEEYFDLKLRRVEGLEIFISGDAMLARDFDTHIKNRTLLLFGIALGLVLLILFIAFRRASDTLIPLSIAGIAMIWVVGFMGWVGIPFSVAGVAIIPLLLGANLTFVVPLIARYYEEVELRFRSVVAVGRALATVGVAIFLAAVTNFFGFLVFRFSPLPALKDFGIVCAVGTVFCFALAIALLPAVLVLRDRRHERPEGGQQDERGREYFDGLSRRKKRSYFTAFMETTLKGCARLCTRHGVFIIIMSAVLIFMGLWFGRDLKTDSDLRKLVPEDLPGITAEYETEEVFGSIEEDIIVAKGDVLTPEFIGTIDELERSIVNHEMNQEAAAPYFERERIIGLPDMIRDANNGRLPESQEEVDRAVETILDSGGYLDGLVAKDRDSTLINIGSSSATSEEELNDKMTIIEESCKEVLGPEGIGYELGGITPLTVDMTKNIVPTALRTSILSIFLCAIILIIIFRSTILGLLTLTVAVAGVAGQLGWLRTMGWPMDIVTSLVAALVIGIGINFGILFTHRFQQEFSKEGVTPAEAVMNTMLNLGRANVVAAIATMAGFLTILFSGIQPLTRFGGTTAAAIFVSLVASLLLLPSLLVLLARRKEDVAITEGVGDGGLSTDST